ncbi:hypothetical protein DIURU_003759 [Diutina rugosa]|uniref:Uncharacterized protein n=1 Tax=Diutina rugosa TaxID=5481 RepID=A0A642UK98_DIURU|nr:uncharacterized protein DIURU_003759 [Diutina rugosa]KAA8900523.1 hypothetical protein DIURU_003759 [Diutina rugosa]
MSPIPNEVINAFYLVGRNFIDDATGSRSDVGGSWRSWDLCMKDTACTVVSIVLIVIGSLIVIWVLGTIFRCFYYGLACGDACFGCFCCCCGRNKRSKHNSSQNYEKPATMYTDPNMYSAQQQPMYPNKENAKYRQAF